MDNISIHIHGNNPFPPVEQFKYLAFLSKSIDTSDSFTINLDPHYPCQVDITLIITSSYYYILKGDSIK